MQLNDIVWKAGIRWNDSSNNDNIFVHEFRFYY